MSRPVRLVYCPGCGALITTSRDGVRECGGEGEGVCAATVYAFDLIGAGEEYARAEYVAMWGEEEPVPDRAHAELIVQAHLLGA